MIKRKAAARDKQSGISVVQIEQLEAISSRTFLLGLPHELKILFVRWRTGWPVAHNVHHVSCDNAVE